jgi:hypothetical protein
MRQITLLYKSTYAIVIQICPCNVCGNYTSRQNTIWGQGVFSDRPLGNSEHIAIHTAVQTHLVTMLLPHLRRQRCQYVHTYTGEYAVNACVWPDTD